MQLLTRVGLSYCRRTAGKCASIDQCCLLAQGIDDRSAQASLAWRARTV